MTSHRVRSLQPKDGGFAIDAQDLAQAFGMTPGEIRNLMGSGGIVTKFESGEGADAGRFRLSFRHGRKTLRLTVDASGSVLFQSAFGLDQQNLKNVAASIRDE